jgi:hypothetical protein
MAGTGADCCHRYGRSFSHGLGANRSFRARRANDSVAPRAAIHAVRTLRSGALTPRPTGTVATTSGAAREESSMLSSEAERPR